MSFPGFEEADFDLFSIPDFAGRMGEIRARLRPKLLALAGDLAPSIEEITGVPTFPHAAQHMRRKVNPPQETWAAWTRDRKGYKRWTHYRAAVSGSGVRVTVFVEDDSDDKPALGRAFRKEAAELLRALQPASGLLWYTLDEERALPHGDLTADRLARTGDDLLRKKTLKFQAGVELPAERAAALPPGAFTEWALEQVRLLRPLYRAGAVGSSRG